MNTINIGEVTLYSMRVNNQIKKAFESYPVYTLSDENNQTQLIQKMIVVQHLVQITEGVNALDVLNILKSVYNIHKDLECGSLMEACNNLKIKIESITDYGTVQYMFENQIQMQNFNKLLRLYL